MEEGEFLSLLTQMMDDCRIMNHVRMDDDYGGYTDTWTEGATFKAAIAKNASPEQQIAEKEGISEAFTVVVEDSFTLDYHDVFKRVRDGAIFRVTSRTTDSTAHPASTVRIAKVTAERWVLPA
ncbi:MAG: head-tail adaptor protein [Bacteroidales bacterium]|nr:head-tail adaptor protein [Bacteroidales bacterium]